MSNLMTGAKMLLERWIHIDILWSLAVIVVVLALSILASLKWPAAGEKTERTGSIFGGHHR